MWWAQWCIIFDGALGIGGRVYAIPGSPVLVFCWFLIGQCCLSSIMIGQTGGAAVHQPPGLQRDWGANQDLQVLSQVPQGRALHQGVTRLG